MQTPISGADCFIICIVIFTIISFQAVTTVGNILYVHGGTTGWEYNSEMHRLNLSSTEWEDMDLDNDQLPPGR